MIDFSVIRRLFKAFPNYKVGLAYGNVLENEKPIKFYFERVDNINE